METLFFRQPRLVVLALSVLIISGISALLTIGRQEDPTITNLFASITTVYPGADPGRVEALVTAKIETRLRTIPEIAEISSTSASSVSVVLVELANTLPAGRIEEVWSRIRDALADVRRDFPPGVQEPEFNSDGAGGYAAIFAVTVPAGQSLARAARDAEALADALRAVPGTRLVDLHGMPAEEVLVSVDPARAMALGLTADAIAAAIRAADAKVQAGRLRGTTSDLLLGVSGEITALDRLRRVVVREDSAGHAVLLGDIADVTRGVREPPAEAALHRGEPAILISARLEDGLQVDRWMARMRATADRFGASMPAGLQVELVFDQSRYTVDRLHDIAINMAQGVALVVVVLFLTLGWRSALIVALALPVVTLASVATLNALGVPIHQMSVTGLIVALGLLVDAAIVMVDEIGSHLRRGAARIAAVAASMRRLAMPLLASTVTTVLSFLPLMLLPGPAGDFVGSIAVAVVVMLVWSLVVAMTITPAVAGWWLPAQGDATGREGPLLRLLGRSLRLSLANPVRSISVALVLPVLGFLSLPTLTAQFFPGVDRDQFTIELEMPEGTALAETARTVRAIDARLRAKPEIAAVSWVVGRSAPAFYYNIVGNRDQAPGFAQALITTTSALATERLLADLQSSLPPAFPGARVLVRGLVQGPPVEAPVELRLVGPDIATLRGIGDELRARVAALPQVTVARTTIAGGAPKLMLDIDEARARLIGLDLAQVARQLEAGLEGVIGGSLLEGTEELPVRVRLGAGLRSDPTAIADMPILPPAAAALSAQGQFPGIALSALGTLRLTPAESPVTRRNGERVNTVQAFLMPGVLPQVALDDILRNLGREGFRLPEGVRMETGGDADARATTVQALIAPLGLIIVLAIAVVVLTFNSFRLTVVAFLAAGLSAGLSLLSLALFNHPFGITAVIGLIGSIGVSINAALIVLSALQEDAAASAGDEAAMAEVVVGSSRHIVSTAATTFGGFLPLILGGGGFWPPFATAIAGGVLLSPLLAFWFTPAMFKLVWRQRAASAGVLPAAAWHQAAYRWIARDVDGRENLRPHAISVGSGPA